MIQVTKDNVAKVAARLGEGSMTVVFRHGCCDSLVVKEVVNRGALTLCHKIISGIWMGVEGVTSEGVAERFGSPPTGGHGAAGSEAGQSLSARGRRKIELTLNKRYNATHFDFPPGYSLRVIPLPTGMGILVEVGCWKQLRTSQQQHVSCYSYMCYLVVILVSTSETI